VLILAGVLISLLTLAPQPGVSTSTPGWELGTRISFDVAGKVTAIRFWKSPDDSGPHVGHVWSAAGVELAKVGFTMETIQGWQEQPLASPLAVTAGQVVTVSVNTTSGGHFAKTTGGLAQGFRNGVLSAPTNGGAYGQPGLFPSSSHADDYYRDLVFDADVPTSGISITADPAGGFVATLNGFTPGPYTLSVTLKDGSGGVTVASLPIIMPPLATAKGPE